MYRVLLADDEVHICQLIQHLVDWNGLDAELCGMAHDGVEALELVQKLRPHIVISACGILYRILSKYARTRGILYKSFLGSRPVVPCTPAPSLRSRPPYALQKAVYSVKLVVL